MTLYKKTLLIISVTILSLLLGLYLASRTIVLRSFVTLEEKQLRQRLEQARSALFDEIAALDRLVFDWALWDDSYEFIADGNSKYILSNLGDTTFAAQKLNLIVYLDAANQIVFQKGFDPEQAKETALPPDLPRHLTPDALLLRQRDPQSRVTGILLLAEGPLLVASRPIMTSAQQGPIRGTLIMGRYLTAAEVAQLANITHLALTVQRFDDPQTPADFHSRAFLSKANPIGTQCLTAQAIAGHILIEDIYGHPSIVLRVDMLREIYQQGQASVFYFVSALFIGSLTLGAVILFLLEKTVLSRVARLSAHVRAIHTGQDLAKRVAVTGQDELAHLADAMNKMLAALEQSHENLLESEERFRRLSEATFEGIMIHDSERIRDVNYMMVEMFGYEVAELIGKPVLELMAPESQAVVLANIRAGAEERYEAKGQRKDGTSFFMEIQAKTLPYQGMHMREAAIRDITWRKLAEKALRQRTREMTLLNHLSDLLQTCATEEETYSVMGSLGKLLFPLDAGCVCMVDAPRTLVNVVAFWGAPPATLTFPADACQVLRQRKSVLMAPAQTGDWCSRVNLASAHGCLCVPIRTAEEILGIFSLSFGPPEPEQPEEAAGRDLESKQMLAPRVATHYALSLANLRLRETLRAEAIRDPLTGLYNRRYMEESLIREAYRAERHHTPVGIIMLDVDHFKRFNDSYGHETGDRVLQALGAFLQNHVRGDDIPCRYGGEEFLLILPEAPLAIVTQRAAALHAGIKALRIRYQETALSVTTSVGVAALPAHGTEIKDVVAAADAALYQAKANGRDQVVTAGSWPQT